ncbi:secretion system protein [Halobacteriales archaeon QS_1_68_20]|nr:MAG: secretion system protein [Halobacteriales archaeon QS_1_68_20]
MTNGPTLEIADGPPSSADRSGLVPPPLPPDDPEAWYAPDVRDQSEVHPGVVATIADDDDGFEYRVREPPLSAEGGEALARLHEYFADASVRRPRTREGAIERVQEGFGEKYCQAIDRLTDLDHEGDRRVTYWALRDARCLEELTPLALDDRIDVADVADGELVVHTDDYAPAATGLEPDGDLVRRFASERVTDYEVEFQGFSVPVIVYRENLLGEDPFATKYDVREPDLLPGDEQLIEECKERIWETGVSEVVEDRAAFVSERARQFLSRRLTARNTRAWLDATRYRVRSALAEYGYAVPPAGRRYAGDRLDDLVYYVLRDYVGEGKLTVPIRDPNLEDVEANAVGERVKVVPRASIDHDGRIPTNLRFESETEFVNVVTQLAAADGTELNASTPSAKVNLDPDGVPEAVTIRCAVALPVISEGGPHVSIRKQAPEAMTPVDLLRANSVSTELVALLWMAYEHHCVVLFSGPTGVGKTTLMNAHMPFVAFEDRPISIDEGSREVRLPHETGVSLTTRDHESEYKRVTMAELMTETNYLNPDVEVIAEINTPASFETFAETLNTGHGVIGTTHAEDVEKLVNRVVEQGLPAYLLQEIDLVVFPKHVDGERYVGEVVELGAGGAGEERGGAVEKDGTTVEWNTVAWRGPDGAFEFAGFDEVAFFRTLADRTDRPLEACREEFRRKHRYVEYLQREGVDDFETLFSLLADLRTNEAATVERIASRDRAYRDGTHASDDGDFDGLTTGEEGRD